MKWLDMTKNAATISAMKIETERQTEVKEALEMLLAAFCDHVKDLRVNFSASPKSPLYVIGCNVNDYGKVCGKMGSMIKALSILTAAMLPGLQPEVILEEKSCVGEKTLREDSIPKAEWDSSELDKILHLTLPLVFNQPVSIGFDQVTSVITKVTIAPHNDHQSDEKIDAAIAVVLKAIGVKQGQILKCEVL